MALPTLFLLYFFLYPFVSILQLGLAPGGRLDLQPFAEIAASSRFRSIAWFTVWQAVLSTMLTVLLAMPAAYVFARFTFRGKSLARALITVPFVLPTVVVGTAFLALLGPDGPARLDLGGSIWAILIAHVFFNYAVVVRTVGTMWERIDPTIEDAARVLGAGRAATFSRVTLPLLRPAITAAASIVFLFTFTSFGVILILGGLQHSTLEVEIWRQTTVFLDLPVAAALAIVQLAGVGIILFLYGRQLRHRRVQFRIRTTKATTRKPTTTGERLLVGGVLAFTALLLGAPLLVLVSKSLETPTGFGLANYQGLFENPTGSALFISPGTALANSLRFAVIATVIALVIGLLSAAVVAYRRGWLAQGFDALLMLPLGTSAVTIGFGLLVALDAPIDLRTSFWLIPIAHALVAIPFVVRTTAPLMQSVRGTLRDAAAVLGAPPATIWRLVDLPIITRAALVGAAFAFAISLGEFGATAFLVRPLTGTMPTAIYRLLGVPGPSAFGQAMAMATILMLVTAGAVMAIERLRVGRLGDF
jgi:thiamine transport system permease protein